MANFDNSAQMGKNIILQFLRDRMQERNMSIQSVADKTGIPRPTLSRNLSGQTEITLDNFLKVLGALEIRPYFIPAETDENQMERVFFN